MPPRASSAKSSASIRRTSRMSSSAPSAYSSGSKKVTVFCGDGTGFLPSDADRAALVFGEFEMEWPPRSGRRQSFPRSTAWPGCRSRKPVPAWSPGSDRRSTRWKCCCVRNDPLAAVPPPAKTVRDEGGPHGTRRHHAHRHPGRGPGEGRGVLLRAVRMADRGAAGLRGLPDVVGPQRHQRRRTRPAQRGVHPAAFVRRGRFDRRHHRQGRGRGRNRRHGSTSRSRRRAGGR